MWDGGGWKLFDFSLLYFSLIKSCFSAGNTGLYQDWMAPLLLPVAFLLRITMCLLSQHLQTSFMYSMWKLDNWENGPCSRHSLFLEDTKNFLGRLLGYLSPLHHPPIHQNHHRLLFIVPGTFLILFVLPCCSGLTGTFVMPYLYLYCHCNHMLVILTGEVWCTPPR